MRGTLSSGRSLASWSRRSRGIGSQEPSLIHDVSSLSRKRERLLEGEEEGEMVGRARTNVPDCSCQFGFRGVD